MKLKSIIAFAGLFSLALFSTAFSEKSELANQSEKEQFLQFLSQFKKVELPYSIGLDDINKPIRPKGKASQKAAKITSLPPLKATPYLPESNIGRFSRMGPPTLYPIARFYPNNQMVAVIYSSQQPFVEETSADYRMVVYDLNGNILPKQKDKLAFRPAFELAHSSLETTTICSIDANGNISQTSYNNQWLKDVYEYGFEGNRITEYKLDKTTNFKLNKNGELTETKYAATASRAMP